MSPEKVPEKWNLPVVFTIGAVLAGVACISSLLLLWFSLDSWRPGSVFQYIGLGGLSYGQVTTSVYLKVSVSDFLTLFSARGGANWFWSTRPALILVMAAAAALGCSTILACAWPASYPDGIYALGLLRRKPFALFVYIWLYCIVWWFVQVIRSISPNFINFFMSYLCFIPNERSFSTHFLFPILLQSIQLIRVILLIQHD